MDNRFVRAEAGCLGTDSPANPLVGDSILYRAGLVTT